MYTYIYMYIYICIYIHGVLFILSMLVPQPVYHQNLRHPPVPVWTFGPGHGQGDPGALADVTTHGTHILMVCIRTLQYTTLSTLH